MCAGRAPPRRPPPSTPHTPPSCTGARSRRRGAANWCACSARSCAPPSPISARLVTLEAGKILSEGLGEVQEMIDICDFAVGLSRQLYGLTIATERPSHRMMETWHPLGVVGVITRLQLPGRGLVLERGARPRLRRRGRLEAVGEDAADRARRAQALFERAAARSAMRPTGLLAAAHRRRASSARRWSTTRASRSSRPPARPRWAARSRRGSPRASPARCSSSAATTPPSSPVGRPRPRRARHRLRRHRHRRPALHHAAPAASCTRASTTTLLARLQGGLRARSPVGDPRDARHAGRPADRRARLRGHAAARSTRRAPHGGARHRRRAACTEDRDPAAYYVRPALVEMPDADRRRAARDLRADPLRAALRDLDEAIALHNDVAAGPVVVDLHQRPARGRALPVGARLRLRHRQRQHRPVRRGDRRRVRRREGDRRRPRVRLRRLEGLHAPRHQHGQLRRDLPLAQGVSFDL